MNSQKMDLRNRLSMKLSAGVASVSVPEDENRKSSEPSMCEQKGFELEYEVLADTCPLVLYESDNRKVLRSMGLLSSMKFF